MNIQEIYKLAIEMGIKADFRSKEKIQKLLKRENEKYAELSKVKKEIFRILIQRFILLEEVKI
ncbi:MAG: hypothetical protein US10_C0035G0009 [Candidatus Moranbacteria bacterium GW2011_GWD2_36_198]|nr:MAG: hypothetical protein US10_C0035G0009 [Candidatus Moranbacteria bacterium GW2011_GWD2_36_198]